MNKKVASEIVIGIILLISAVFIFLFYFEDKKEFIENSTKSSEKGDVKFSDSAVDEKKESGQLDSNKQIEYGYGNLDCVDGIFKMNDVQHGGWGIGFNCTEGVESIQNDNGQLSVYSNLDEEHDMTIFYNKYSELFNPPLNVDIYDWVINKNKYLDDYNAKVINDFPKKGMSSLHIPFRSEQSGVYDKIFIADKGKMFEVTIFSVENDCQGKTGTVDCMMNKVKNIDLNDDLKWYVKILRSFNID